MLQSDSRKSLSFLKHTERIAFIYVLLSENRSGQKFLNDAQQQDCIRTESGSALSQDREGTVNGTQFQRPS